MTSQYMSMLSNSAILAVVALLAGPASADDLSEATKSGDVVRAVALLKSGADPNIRSPYDGPLHLAARLGPPELVIALLKAGANIELPGYGGARPLHSATLAGQTKIVAILLESGAEVDALDNVGRTPLMTFVSGEGADVATLKLLLKAGADPNLIDDAAHLYALDYAAMLGRVDEASLLVAAGANVNARDALYGKSPLHYATGCDNLRGGQEVAQFLIDHGADVNAKDYAGMTPLDNARRYAPNNGLLMHTLEAPGAH